MRLVCLMEVLAYVPRRECGEGFLLSGMSYHPTIISLGASVADAERQATQADAGLPTRRGNEGRCCSDRARVTWNRTPPLALVAASPRCRVLLQLLRPEHACSLMAFRAPALPLFLGRCLPWPMANPCERDTALPGGGFCDISKGDAYSFTRGCSSLSASRTDRQWWPRFPEDRTCSAVGAAAVQMELRASAHFYRHGLRVGLVTVAVAPPWSQARMTHRVVHELLAATRGGGRSPTPARLSGEAVCFYVLVQGTGSWPVPCSAAPCPDGGAASGDQAIDDAAHQEALSELAYTALLRTTYGWLRRQVDAVAGPVALFFDGASLAAIRAWTSFLGFRVRRLHLRRCHSEAGNAFPHIPTAVCERLEEVVLQETPVVGCKAFLSQCSRLRRLVLVDVPELPAGDSDAVEKAFLRSVAAPTGGRTLRELFVAGYSVIKHVSLLTGCTQLRALNVTHTEVEKDELVSLLPGLRWLEELHLDGCHNLDDLGAVLDCVRDRPLRVLGLRGLHELVDNTTVAVVAACFSSSLEEISLGRCDVTDISALAGCSELHRLELPEQTTVDRHTTTKELTGIRGLVETLGVVCPGLMQLRLKGLGTLDCVRGFHHLGTCLPQLRALYLSACPGLDGVRFFHFGGSMLFLSGAVHDIATLEQLVPTPGVLTSDDEADEASMRGTAGAVTSHLSAWSTGLVELSLNCCSALPPDGMTQLLVRRCPHLRALHLAECSLNNASLAALCAHLLHLEQIDLSRCHGITDVSPLLTCTALTSVKLMDGVTTLHSRVLQLQALDGVKGVLALVSKLCPALRGLRLSRRGTMEACDLAQVRLLGRWVARVDMCGIDCITRDVIDALCCSPAARGGSLRAIDVSHTSFDNTMLRVLASCLRESIEVLLAQGCFRLTNITPLKQCTRLLVLNISETYVDGARTFAALQRLPRLQELDLRRCSRLRDLTPLTIDVPLPQPRNPYTPPTVAINPPERSVSVQAALRLPACGMSPSPNRSLYDSGAFSSPPAAGDAVVGRPAAADAQATDRSPVVGFPWRKRHDTGEQSEVSPVALPLPGPPPPRRYARDQLITDLQQARPRAHSAKVYAPFDDSCHSTQQDLEVVKYVAVCDHLRSIAFANNAQQVRSALVGDVEGCLQGGASSRTDELDTLELQVCLPGCMAVLAKMRPGLRRLRVERAGTLCLSDLELAIRLMPCLEIVEAGRVVKRSEPTSSLS